ncbi:MAG: integration host factor, actinobacterial type [Nitriliruptorales bacterium]|nr:integration host factor, actinobacterial type [Nitriliruptorales bacterium]
MPVPELDPEQRQAALEKAKESRRIRAELKQMLKAGEVQISQVLARAEHADALAKMRASDLIGAMPNVGKVGARRLMNELGIADGRRLQGLGPRQREALIDHFEG